MPWKRWSATASHASRALEAGTPPKEVAGSLSMHPYAAKMLVSRVKGRAPEDLDARIERRVEIMWAAGLIDEVRRLPDIRSGRTASRALGYQQAIAQIDGEMSAEEAMASTIQGTRRFVRRQRSWFRRDPAIVWIDGASDTLVADALAVTE